MAKQSTLEILSGEKTQRRKVDPLKDTIAGGFGGLCIVLVGHPFDTIKVRLQTTPHFSGMIDCASKTIRNEGFRGLYKGMSAPLAGTVPVFALTFFGYSVGKRLQQQKPDDQLRPIQLFAAGALSGCMTTTIVAPGERIKCLLQVQQNSIDSNKYSGPGDVIKKLYKDGGLRSIYRGTFATLLRDVPATGMYFMTYEWVKNKLSGGNDNITLLPTMAAGGLAGIANWIVALPPDNVKSRLQTAPEGTYPGGMRQVAREMMTKHGVSAFFTGFAPVFTRAFLANAVCFLGYELALWSMDRMWSSDAGRVNKKS